MAGQMVLKKIGKNRYHFNVGEFFGGGKLKKGGGLSGEGKPRRPLYRAVQLLYVGRACRSDWCDIAESETVNLQFLLHAG